MTRTGNKTISFEKLANFNSKRRSDFIHYLDGWVSYTTLNSADVCAVQT